MLGNEQDAQDATQEALIAIVRGLPGFDGRSAFSTWAYRITTNSALDEMRRRRRRPVPWPRDAGGDEIYLDSGGPSTTASREARVDPPDTVGARLDVDAALQRLPGQQRAAIVLRDLLDLDYAEIAEVLAIPIGTVRSRIARGRAALATVLASGHEQGDDTTAEPSRAPLAGEGNSV